MATKNKPLTINSATVNAILNDQLDTLSDRDLDSIIFELSTRSAQELGPELEHAGRLAAQEWRIRYPDTICPSLWQQARDDGGFPSGYTGPTDTIALPVDKELN